jgi:flagellar basal-body rod protein FlgB
MFIDIFSNDKIPLMLGKVIDCTTRVHDVISSNIANVETPGYKAKNVSFQSLLNSYVDQIDITEPSEIKQDQLDFEPDIFEISGGNVRRDGNNVDIDSEMVKLSENQIKNYEAIQLLRKRQEMLSFSIMEGR